MFAQDNSSDEAPPHRRMLRRETAVELPITPSKLASAAASASGTQSQGDGAVSTLNERTLSAERGSPNLNRNTSTESGYSRQGPNYLAPSVSDASQHCYRKSIESLPKNSSSETEYSAQPYKVIKQSSNETNTSLTGSFNVDQSSFGGHDVSMETMNDSTGPNVTVIENTGQGKTPSPSPCRVQSKTSLDETPTTSSPKPSRQISLDGGMRALKKQFSIDHGLKAFSPSPVRADANEAAAQKPSALRPPAGGVASVTPTKLSAIMSSSTSTEESKDERNIPSINTNVIQDEIAKLSSNINNSSGEDDSKEPPFNETMC